MANDRLAALMREAGFSAPDGSVGRKVFARAVQEVAASHGVVRKFNHTYVSRWLRGVLPRDVETRGFIAEALAKRLGRPVALHEIGLDSPDVVPPDLGTRYPAKHTESTQVLARLLQADLDQLPIFLRAVPDVAAWNEAALTWLVSSGPPERPTGNTGHRVGTADVARLRAMVRSFDQLDGQFGGGHARRALVEYLRHDLTRLLSGTYSEEVGRQLFEAAAQALQLVAWMSYDAGLHDLAGRYFVQALRLAESSGNQPRSRRGRAGLPNRVGCLEDRRTAQLRALRTYVQEFRDRLAKVGFANRTVREFVEQARSYKLWTTQATTR